MVGDRAMKLRRPAVAGPFRPGDIKPLRDVAGECRDSPGDDDAPARGAGRGPITMERAS